MFSKWRQLTAELGRRAALVYTLSKLASAMHLPLQIRYYHIVAQPILCTPRLSKKRRALWRWEQLTQDDPRLAKLPLEDAVLKLRFSQGTQCFGLFQAEQLVAYIWLARGCYFEDEVRCQFLLSNIDESVWDFDVYVFPKHRMGFAFMALWDAADEFLRERNVRWSFSRISAFNRQSVRSHESLGATRCASAIFFTLGKMQISLITQQPRIHFSLSENAAPTIELHPPAT